MMRRVFIVTMVLCSFVVSGQEEGRPVFHGNFSGRIGLGTPSAWDIAGRNLRQDISRSDNYRYRMGIVAGVLYQWSPRYSVGMAWNRGGSVVTVDRSLRATSITLNALSFFVERRYAIKNGRYCYSSVGLSLKREVEEKISDSGAVSKRVFLSSYPIPIIVPLGVCWGTTRAKGYIEMGLFFLPLVNGGVRVAI